MRLSFKELADQTDSLSEQQATLQLHPPTPVVSVKHVILPQVSPLLHLTHLHPIKTTSNLQWISCFTVKQVSNDKLLYLFRIHLFRHFNATFQHTTIFSVACFDIYLFFSVCYASNLCSFLPVQSEGQTHSDRWSWQYLRIWMLASWWFL